MKLESKKYIESIKSTWIKYEYKLVLIIGFVLIAGISFEFGLIQGKKGYNSPLVIEKPIQTQKEDVRDSSTTPSQAQNLTQEAEKAQSGSIMPTSSTNCAFVGSKNSDKFYPPSCSYAKRIKPENIVCFATAQEALDQGRTASTGCK